MASICIQHHIRNLQKEGSDWLVTGLEDTQILRIRLNLALLVVQQSSTLLANEFEKPRACNTHTSEEHFSGHASHAKLPPALELLEPGI